MAFQSLNDMQQTVIYYIILQLYTLLPFKCTRLFNAVISLDYVLPNDLHEMRFAYCNFLKQKYISHILKYISFSADKALPCNTHIHYVTTLK